jgi:hypothetical protein
VVTKTRSNSGKAERSFPFLRINEREAKPRKHGLTEIRGPYYSVVGRRYLEDLFETMGNYVDSLKFAGGSFTLMPERAVRDIVDLCRKHDVLVSTGGFIERVLPQGGESVRQYLAECKKLGFDIVEISAGFVSIPTDDWLRLIEFVRKSGLKAKPEAGIQFGAGGATAAAELEAEGTRAPSWAIAQAKTISRCRCGHHHDRKRRHHRECRSMADGCASAIHQRVRNGEADVRSRRSRRVRMVHQKLRSGCEPLCRSQPNRAAGVFARWHLGHEKSVGTRGDV